MSAKSTVEGLKASLSKLLPADSLSPESVEQCQDIFQQLEKCNVTLQILTQTLIGTIVSKFKAHEVVGPSAKALVKKWKKVAKEGPGASPATAKVIKKIPKPEKAERRESVSSAAAEAELEWAGLQPHRQTTARKLHSVCLASKSSLVKQGINAGAVEHLAVERATEIEAAIHKKFTQNKVDYLGKARSLCFNIKKNVALTTQILLGQISGEELVAMSSEQLASEEKRKEMEERARKMMDTSRLDWEQANEDKINEMCGIKGDLLKASLFTCGRYMVTHIGLTHVSLQYCRLLAKHADLQQQPERIFSEHERRSTTSIARNRPWPTTVLVRHPTSLIGSSMTPTTSSPVSSNSFPSSTTSKGQDENKFPLQTPTWNKKGTTTMLESRKGTPLSSNNPQPSQFTTPSEGWSMFVDSSSSPAAASSPLPPRLSSKLRQSPHYTNGAVTTPHKGSTTHVSTSPALDPRSTVNGERLPAPPTMDVAAPADSASRRRQATEAKSQAQTNSVRRDSPSVQSQTSGAGDWQFEQNNDPDDQEQALFEQRLCDDVYGVAVRKINQNGKSNLRYVKCCDVDASELEGDSKSGFTSSTRSLSSTSRGRFSRFRDRSVERNDKNEPAGRSLLKGTKVKVLMWGKKKDVRLPLDKFVAVRKGKTTDRARRNLCPAARILSLITDDPHSTSLDIEAPTRLDRDKFARAFARFLCVPLEGDDVRSIRSDMTPQSFKDPTKAAQPGSKVASISLSQMARDSSSNKAASSQSTSNNGSRKPIPLPIVTTESTPRSTKRPPATRNNVVSTSSARMSQEAAAAMGSSSNTMEMPDPQMASLPSTVSNLDNSKGVSGRAANSNSYATTRETTSSSDKHVSTNSEPDSQRVHLHDADDASAVSSITGGGYDQEIVEELHMALTDLRTELDESRAEAARAVKVAEQAIQSAEQNNSKDWNSTVTHKAAEAAALAQKKSAEALAKARLAEERLFQEKKKSSAWKKKAESAGEEAGHWQTRAAAAEVQRAALAESLEHERAMTGSGATSKPFGADMSQGTVDRLRSKLALESAARRKLLGELQDLRGTVRVYCRPRVSKKGVGTLSTPSQGVLLLHRDRSSFQEGTPSSAPLSFEFDGILGSEMQQKDVYDELESLCLGALDGFKICVMTYGSSNSGTTYTMLGEVAYDASNTVSITDYGIHLRAAQQFFALSKHRSQMFKDVVTFQVVEVNNERLTDLLAGTDIGERQALAEAARKGNRKRVDSQDGTASSSSKVVKLEIKTNRDGETTVNGLLSVEVSSFEDVLQIWRQSLGRRATRLSEMGTDVSQHNASSHLIGTFKIASTNLSTGVTTSGKIQFVDLAASDVVPRHSTSNSSKKVSTPESAMSGVGNTLEWRYENKSMSTLNEVVTARSQFQRKVPYRNSTITHLLSDSLEADTKVALVACVSSNIADLQASACTLRFTQALRKVVIGKATKHTVTHS